MSQTSHAQRRCNKWPKNKVERVSREAILKNRADDIRPFTKRLRNAVTISPFIYITASSIRKHFSVRVKPPGGVPMGHAFPSEAQLQDSAWLRGRQSSSATPEASFLKTLEYIL